MDEESDPLLKLVEALTLADTFHAVMDSAGSVAFARKFCQALLRNAVFSRIAQFLQDYVRRVENAYIALTVTETLLKTPQH